MANSGLPIVLEPSDGYDFEMLARYNSEVSHGIMHTSEWDALMVAEQERFNRQQMDKMIAEGGHPLDPNNPDGAWIVPGPRPSGWQRLVWWIQDRLP